MVYKTASIQYNHMIGKNISNFLWSMPGINSINKNSQHMQLNNIMVKLAI